MEPVIVKFLSILRVCKINSPLYFSRWKIFFSSPNSSFNLGEKFQELREEKKLSIDEIASKLFVPNAVIELLEKGESEERTLSSLLSPGYARLIAVAYARLLGLNIKEISLFLPPPAPLKFSTFVKKLSPLQQHPHKPHFIRQKQHLTYTLNDVKSFLLKMVKVIIALVILFYSLNFLRHLGRVIF